MTHRVRLSGTDRLRPRRRVTCGVVFHVLGAVCLVSACADPTASLEPASAVDSTTEDVVEDHVCDGSHDLRMVVRSGGVGGGIIGPTRLYHQIGTFYLYIRGDCQYWVMGPSGDVFYAWDSARTGTLDLDQAKDLMDGLGYEQWGIVKGDYESPHGGDGDAFVLSDLRSTVVCRLGCSDALVGTPQLRAWAVTARQWWTALHRAGEPLDRSDRLRVDGRYLEVEDGGQFDCPVQWPFSFSPERAGISPPPSSHDDPLRSRAVTDPSMAADLRQYWAMLRAGRGADDPCSLERRDGAMYFSLPEHPGLLLEMWIRDAVPFEDDDGHVLVPEPTRVLTGPDGS